MKTHSTRNTRNPGVQAGMTLLETAIAMSILLVATVGVVSLAIVGTQTTENQGHLAARTTEYAQDKMEQLLSLAYCDQNTDTTVFPAGTAGTGLRVGTSPDCTNDRSISGTGGSSDPTAPAAGYVDYLDISGNQLALGAGGGAPANWYYIRVWQISTLTGCAANCTMKQITVTAKVQNLVGGRGSGAGSLPQSTITTLKTSPF